MSRTPLVARPLGVILALSLLVALCLAGPLQTASAGTPERAAALVQKLKTRTVKNVEFEEVDLQGFVRWLRIATGSNFVIRHKALAKAGIDLDEIEITLKLEQVTIATLLEVVLEPYDLAAMVKGNLVYVTTRVDAMGPPVTRLYAISHITWTKVDFIAPEINLNPSGYTPVEDYEPERIVEDDPLNSGDAVAELVQEIVAPGEWDNEGWSIRATDRYLVVRAPKSVHVHVDRALAIIASLK